MSYKNIAPFSFLPSVRYSYDLISLYADAAKRMTYTYLIVYAFIIPIMTIFVPVPFVLLWSCLAFIHLLLRHLVSKKLFTCLISDKGSLDKYLRWSIYLTIYSGVLWGSLVWFNFLYLPNLYHYVSVAVILVVAAAAIGTLSMIFVSYLTFFSTMMFLLFAALLSTGERDDMVIALMVVVYILVIVPIARLLYKRTKESFELSVTLQESESKLAALNETLEEHVKEKTKELHHNYYHDQLTGLPNLRRLEEIVQEEGEENYIVILDIREFGIFNKQYGKKISDEILVLASDILKRQLRSGISLFRGENDRFIVYCENMSLEQTQEFTDQIISFFEVYLFEVQNIELFVTFKAGISDSCKSIEEGLVHADYALTMAKRKEMNFYVYDVSQEELLAEKDVIEWLAQTKELILGESIFPLFQPIYDIYQKKIIKYECLARGRVEGKIIAPYKFLNAAERLELTTNITRTMIDKSFAFFKYNRFSFSINLTGADLLDARFIEFLELKLKRHNMDPTRVTFEILESVTTYSSTSVMLESLKKIKHLGFKLAIDDFGVENSNFSRLLEIELDFIKIDGLFIKNIAINEKDKKIVLAIVGLAKNLGVETIAEFVETKEVLEVLRECGVDHAQGYFIGKPQEYLLDEDQELKVEIQKSFDLK